MEPQAKPGPATAATAPGVLVAAIDFGLGPAGKLASVVGTLEPGRAVYACGAPLPTALFDRPFTATCWSHDRQVLRRFAAEHRLERALVVLDPHLAADLQDLGIAVVYVDSLPFLWTEADPLPVEVAAYCAQRCAAPPSTSLQRVRNLHWVEGIVPHNLPARAEVEGGAAVVHLGGLHSPLGENHAYVDLVIPAVLATLARTGLRRVVIAAGEPAAERIRQRHLAGGRAAGLAVEASLLPRARFHAAVARCSMLITAPGLTTLLEASAIGTPTLLLPPQNLSQYHNAEAFRQADHRTAWVDWGVEQLAPEAFASLLPQGEDVVVREIQERITALADDPGWRERFEGRLLRALDGLRSRPLPSALSAHTGRDGARQVAALLEDAAATQETGAPRGATPVPPSPAELARWLHGWLATHCGGRVPAGARLFGSLLDSLALLRLVVDCERELALQVPLTALRPQDLDDLESLARALSDHAVADQPREWLQVAVPPEAVGRELVILLAIRTRFPGVLARMVEDPAPHLALGVPVAEPSTRQRLHRFLTRRGANGWT